MPDLSVGCVMVVANGERYLREQLDSMVTQTRPLDEIVVVDDHSTDNSLSVIDDALRATTIRIRRLTALPAQRWSSLYSRIARNFVTGIDASTTDVVLLADQDDIWSPNRVRLQLSAFESDAKCALVVGNGELIDGESESLGRSLRDAFPVPGDWDSLTDADRRRFVLQHPVATGAACAVMPSRMPGHGKVPRGWLHDRWYSLEATYAGRVLLDDRHIMKYRQHDSQVVGLSGEQATPIAQVGRRLAKPGVAAKKFADLSRLARRAPGTAGVLHTTLDLSGIPGSRRS